MNKIYIANFGRKNYEWPECLKRNTVATMNNLDAHAAWLANDKDAYHKISMRPAHRLDNKPPTPAVTTKWFNMTTTVNDTVGDIWMHCERDANFMLTGKKSNREKLGGYRKDRSPLRELYLQGNDSQ